MNTHRIDEVMAFWERKSKKAVQLFALLRDPDLADVVEALKNGSAPPKPESPLLEHSGLRETIRALLPAMPETFTSGDVLEVLLGERYPFGERDAKSAIRDQLYELTKLGEIRVVKKGKGGKPNVLQRVTV